MLHRFLSSKLLQKKLAVMNTCQLGLAHSVFLILFLLLSSSCFADSFSPNGYKYYKDVLFKKTLTLDTSGYYGKVLLDEDMMRYSGENDRRLVYKNRLVPFFVRPVLEEKGTKGFSVPKILFSQKKKDESVYVLQLPEIPEDTEYKEIILESEGSYDTTATLSLGEKPDEWLTNTFYNLNNYYEENKQFKKVEFHSGKYRYARLTLKSLDDIKIPQALYYPTTKQSEYSTIVPLSEIKNRKDADKHSSLFYYENPLHKLVYKIKVGFIEPRFLRNISIYEKKEKSFQLVTSGQIEKSEKTGMESIIYLRNTIQGEIKIEVSYKDDSPLTLSSLELFTPKQELIFSLPSDTIEPGSLRLYYGNPYAYYPQFDFFTLYDASRKLYTFQTGEHTNNDKFSYSVVEPPMSSWIIRITYIFGLLLLSYPTFRAFISYTDKEKETTKAGSTYE
jgi:hypothetical protein